MQRVHLHALAIQLLHVKSHGTHLSRQWLLQFYAKCAQRCGGQLQLRMLREHQQSRRDC